MRTDRTSTKSVRGADDGLQNSQGLGAWLGKLLGRSASVAPANLQKTTSAYAARPEATQALLTGLENVAAQIDGVSSVGDSARARMERAGPVSEVITQREREMPYVRPAQMLTVSAEAPLDLSALDPDQTYLWVLDAQDQLHFAPERQAGHGVAEGRPDGRKVNHGDMNPGEGGRSRGPARSGGELTAERLEDGSVRWTIDLNSSYAFNRIDGRILKSDALAAVVEHLEVLGSKVDGLAQGGSVYNPLMSLVGKVERTLQRMGIAK